jgi:hypothetical protein
LSSRNKSQKSADAGVNMVPFKTGLFDGTVDERGRQVLANMMMARLFQFGEFFQWSKSTERGSSLMVKYKRWEGDQALMHNEAKVTEAVFRVNLFTSLVTTLQEESGILNPGSVMPIGRRKLNISKSFIKMVTGGLRKYVPAFQDTRGPHPCTFYQSARCYMGANRNDSESSMRREIEKKPRKNEEKIQGILESPGNGHVLNTRTRNLQVRSVAPG